VEGAMFLIVFVIVVLFLSQRQHRKELKGEELQKFLEEAQEVKRLLELERSRRKSLGLDMRGRKIRK